MKRTICAAFVVFLAGSAARASEFETPRKIQSAGRPIDVQRTGHSAPFVGDFDGDGEGLDQRLGLQLD